MAGKRAKESVFGAEFDAPARPDGPVKIVKPAELKVTKDMASALVGLVQTTLAALPWTREDILSDSEQKLLVADIVDFARTNLYFARAIIWMFHLTEEGGLPLDAGALVGSRLARHNVVPAQVGLAAEMVLAISASQLNGKAGAEARDEIASLFSGLSDASGDGAAPSRDHEELAIPSDITADLDD